MPGAEGAQPAIVPVGSNPARQECVTSSLGPLVFECSQHRQTLRPSVDRIRGKALHPFGLQSGISRIQQYSEDGSQ